jgi:hypothetical protein
MDLVTHADLARMRSTYETYVHAGAKNNFICVSVVKRDKRMRDARRCAGRYPGAGLSHAWAYLQLQCPFYRTGRTHRIVLTIVYNVTQSVENKPKMRIICSVKFYACGPIPRAWANPHDTKNVLIVSYLFLMLTLCLLCCFSPHLRDKLVSCYACIRSC